MATVTMTGKEYEELLMVKRQYEELMELMCGTKLPTISSDPELAGWAIQTKPELSNKYPAWLLEQMSCAALNKFRNLDDLAFKNIVKENWRYYDVDEGSFTTYSHGNTTIDLWEDAEILARWENARKELEANE